MRWKLEEKRAIKDFEEVIKGNEAKILAIYQATPYLRLDYSPEGLQKLLNSLEVQDIHVGDWTTLREQIIELWESRGLEVLDIEVDSRSHGSWKWTVFAKEKKKIKLSELEAGAEEVNEGFIIALETIADTLKRAADQINEIKEDLGTGNIRLQDAIKKRDMVLQEIGKWGPGEERE